MFLKVDLDSRKRVCDPANYKNMKEKKKKGTRQKGEET